MSSLFDSLINSKLDGTRFSFYADKEIENISVKEISNVMAYDEHGHPTVGGIVDEHLGVSALDTKTLCRTCGCGSMHCPGHLGHIKLISTCYNPFTINLLHKLIKAKCIACHRLRIYPQRIELFEIRLQLIKLGYLIEAAQLGTYTDFGIESIEASIRILRRKLSKKTKIREGDEENDEVGNDENEKALSAFEKLGELEKENREIFFVQIKAILEEKTQKAVTNTSITIAIRKLIKEILASIIPSKCPH